MFADPLNLANTGTTISLPRVDAGQMSGTFMKVIPGTSSDVLAIRNSSYVNKKYRRTMSRHNVEITRITNIAATTTAPETFKVLKAYVVVEHDDKGTLAEIQAISDQVASFFIEAKNAGFVQRLVNNEG